MAIIVDCEYTKCLVTKYRLEYHKAMEMLQKSMHETTKHYWDGKATVLKMLLDDLKDKRIVKGRDNI